MIDVICLHRSVRLNCLVYFLEVSYWRTMCVNLQNFLCYSCEEYVEDLSKVPKDVVEVSLERPEAK